MLFPHFIQHNRIRSNPGRVVRNSLAFCALLLTIAVTAHTSSAAVIVVTNTNDTGTGSLRQAILDSNSSVGVLDTINFNIAGAGVHTIAPTSALPTISDPVTIDGYTQPGASVNTMAVGDNAVLLIELNGTSAGSSGLTITGGGSTIRGLVINRFGSQFTDSGIFLQSDNNVIAGNFIGIDPAGSVELGNVSGVRVATGANNLIGGTTPAARNVISGNGTNLGNVVVDQIFLSSDPAPSGTIIRGNYIGTNAAGTVAVLANPSGIGNTRSGVSVQTSTGTIIGGSDADDGLLDGNVGARNVISGNIFGINTEESSSSFQGEVTVQGNFIGVDATGNAALGNFQDGIRFGPSRDRSDSIITVGGTAAGAGNVISGNIGVGVSITNSNAVMQGNRIGTNLAGTLDLGNGNAGVELTRGGSPPFPVVQFTVGGAMPAARNIISGNGGFGLRVNNLSGPATVQGNYIGTQSDGVSPLGNDSDGIYAQEAQGGATIGGTGAGEGNVIAFNGGGIFGGAGITIPSAIGITILGNSIFSNGGLGIDLGGGGPMPNDDCDADTGPNNLQNFPTLTSASSGGGSTTVQGSLNSTANTTFRIEFFSSAACDSSGNGEGQTFLGFATVTTNGTCTANINATLPVAVMGTVVTATATDPNGNTSEFSGCVQVTGGPTPTPTATPTATPSQLLNISTRMRVQTGENVLIGGFIITGTGPKRVILRGIGPSLSGQGLTGVLPDPTLELHGAVSINNDNWRDTQEAEIQATGIPPSNDLESAIVASLEPGAYTAILAGKENTTGIGLVEVYDLDQPAGSKLANISTRGFVETGDNVMIGGFIAGPTDTGPTTVLIRAIGPSLGAVGIQDSLQDPTLELHDGSGALIAMNDNWRDTQQAEIIATGIPPTDDRESAILQTLAPGNYTAIVRGKDNTTGVALVEAYNLQ